MAKRLVVSTQHREDMVDITERIRELARDTPSGVMHLWALHTTCALTVNEGADPDVARDIVVKMRHLIPQKEEYRHAEGNADAHIKTALFGPGLTLLIEAGDLAFGNWQHVFLAEWDGPRQREIAYLIIPVSG